MHKTFSEALVWKHIQAYKKESDSPVRGKSEPLICYAAFAL
jgi:hypothetical protein